MRWPGKIPAGRRTSEIAANMDIFPSVAKIAGAELPADRILDGRDLTPLITGKTESGPHETFYFFGDSYTEDWQPNKIPNLLAIRKGRWKLHFQTTSGRGTGHGRELYDLGSDVGEEYNRIEDNPDIAKELESEAAIFLAEFNQHIRPYGVVAREK